MNAYEFGERKMLSMTGYGRAEYLENGISLTVEIRSVNNRNFDCSCKMPRAFIAFEDKIRKTVNGYISRGKVDVFINFNDLSEKPATLEVNLQKAVAYYQASESIAEKLGLNNDVTVSNIMKCPEVITDNSLTDYTELESTIIDTVKLACEKFNSMREIEGKKLLADMLARMNTIRELVEKVKERAPLVAQEYKEKLKNRIEEALLDVKYDESRLLSEVAFYTDRVNIDEEITRLNSHITQFENISKVTGSGKKLDFLMQEFNRETNTICSKSNDLQVTEYGLSLKNEIEKVREQVQNLE